MVCGFQVVGSKDQASKLKHSVLSLQHDFYEAVFLLYLLLVFWCVCVLNKICLNTILESEFVSVLAPTESDSV